MKSSKYYICKETIWPELSLVCMSTELQFDTGLCYFLHLIWCMIDEYRRSISIISWKGSDSFCYILAFTGFWVVYTDDIETIESYLFVSENPSLCMPKCAECSLNSEVCFVIAISIDDTMCGSYIIEWVEEVLESSIHTIEEVSCDTEKFHIFRIDHLYDIAKILRSIDMSNMYI